MITSDNSSRLIQPVDVMHNNSANMFNLANPCCYCCRGIIFLQKHYSFNQNELKKYLTFEELREIIIPFGETNDFKCWSYFQKIYLFLILGSGVAAILGFILTDADHPPLAVWLVFAVCMLLVLFFKFIQACVLKRLCNNFDKFLENYNEQSQQRFKIKLIRNRAASLQDGFDGCYGELCSYQPLGLRILPKE